MTKTIKDLAHYDIVGSFLRPEELKKARKDFSERKISQDELKEIEKRKRSGAKGCDRWRI